MFRRHPGVAFWCHVCSQINKKTTMESVLPLGGPNDEKVTNMDPKLVPRGSQIHQNQLKIQPFPGTLKIKKKWAQGHQKPPKMMPKAFPGTPISQSSAKL